MRNKEAKYCNDWRDFFGEAKPPGRRPRGREHDLQSSCVRWFRLQYPTMRHNLFAVPNGGKRDKMTAARLKEEGQLAGVADLILLKRKGECGALLLEAKVKGNYQQGVQREWQRLIEADGYIYRVFHSLEEFIDIINNYLKDG